MHLTPTGLTIKDHLLAQHAALPQYIIDGHPIHRIVMVDKPRAMDGLLLLPAPCLYAVAADAVHQPLSTRQATHHARNDLHAWNLVPVPLAAISYGTFELGDQDRSTWEYTTTEAAKEGMVPIQVESMDALQEILRETWNRDFRLYQVAGPNEDERLNVLFIPKAAFAVRRLHKTDAKKGDPVLNQSQSGTLSTPQLMVWHTEPESCLYVPRVGAMAQAQTTPRLRADAHRTWLQQLGYRTFDVTQMTFTPDLSVLVPLTKEEKAQSALYGYTAPHEPFSQEATGLDAWEAPVAAMAQLYDHALQAAKVMADCMPVLAKAHRANKLGLGAPLPSNEDIERTVRELGNLWYQFSFDRPPVGRSAADLLAATYLSRARGGQHPGDSRLTSAREAFGPTGVLNDPITNARVATHSGGGRKPGSKNRVRLDLTDVRPEWFKGAKTTKHILLP